MKAYQLKIVINGSKPPIWRRCIVPAGITFSELGVILNTVMGWSGAHLSEFEFYHQELRVTEDMEIYEDIGYDKYDCVEASSTYISEYMENNGWFTYTYDFGDDWSHRVTIEKVLPYYPLNYPQVIKYKGACPMEDCGGIGGYYECLEIMADENHPEHEMRCEWAESQGYEPEYDMEYVNEILESQCFLIWGKGDKRTIGEIYEDFCNGTYGLKATESDKNKTKPRRSKRHSIDDSISGMANLIKQYNKYYQDSLLKNQLESGWDLDEEIEPDVRLKDIISSFDKEDLLELAEEKGCQISKYNKAKLTNAIVKEMLNPEKAEPYFACIGTKEQEAFERAIENGGVSEEGEINFRRLYTAFYVGVRDDVVMIPKEVEELYHSLKTDEFEKKRKSISSLVDCFDAVSLCRLKNLLKIKPFCLH